MAVVFLATFTACSGTDEERTNYDDVSLENLKPVQLNFYVMRYMGDKDIDIKEVDNIMKEIELYMDQPHLLSSRYRGVAVASNSKNPERVLMFLEWLHKSQENYDLFRYGIKDRHYGLKGENFLYRYCRLP
ncbi:hypothetical protein [Acetivibrio clariflavus]|uniref:hypothetical protein n=1 Tax=Acetivibrio clariflavus TaxID=288965 RepID=UPI000483C414|nr:hypothetical protein [Acetivibrio clariflavus]